MRCRFLSLLVLACLPLVQLPGQTHLFVDVRDPVYKLIELGELRGAITRLSAVKPYTRSQVISLLDQMLEHRELFSAYERGLLPSYIDRIVAPGPGPMGRKPTEGRGSERVEAGVDFKADGRLNANMAEDWHMDSVTRAFVRGDLAPWFSYMGGFGFTLDRVGEEAFAPYAYTKEWDAFHLSFGEPRYSYGDLAYPTVSYELTTDITASFLSNRAIIRMARMRRDWGLGDGSLTLSSTARPFVGVETHAVFAPWIGLSYVCGSLGDWSRDLQGMGFSGTELPGLPGEKVTYQKLFILQRLELFPFPWLYLSASSSVITAKRFEIGHLSPLLFSLIYQNLMADVDNVGVGVDVAFLWTPYGKAYFSFYADEMEPATLRELFGRPRNMFAFQAGVKLSLPWIPFAHVTLQYTKIEPFTYAHYPTLYAHTYPVYVETSYTHDGENLAYPLYPNSDEFLLGLWSHPIASWTAGLQYRLIRHGDNPDRNPGDLAILGRPEAYLDYSAGLDNYPNKVFLKDGLYDFNHIVTLSAEYTIPKLPITVGASYTFSYTFWRANDSGLTEPPDQIKNILALSVKVFR